MFIDLGMEIPEAQETSQKTHSTLTFAKPLLLGKKTFLGHCVITDLSDSRTEVLIYVSNSHAVATTA